MTRTLRSLVALQERRMITLDLSKMKTQRGFGKTSTEPRITISGSGQVFLNTYISKHMGITPKTKSAIIGIRWDEDSRRMEFLFNSVKEIQGAEFKHLGAKTKKDGQSAPTVSSLFGSLAGVFQHDSIAYDYKGRGNQGYEATPVFVDKKKTTLWGYAIELPEGEVPAEEKAEKPAKAKPVSKAKVTEPEEDEDEDTFEESEEDEEEPEEEEDEEEEEEEDPEPVKPSKKAKTGKR